MDPVAAFLRQEKERLTEQWAHEVRNELPALAQLPGPVLIDHLPEVLEALGAWIDGDTNSAYRGFKALVEGHALQRLGYAVGLETLMREYAKLRFVVARELLDLPAPRESMLLLHEGFDRAIVAAIDCYSERREEIRTRFISILGHDLRDPLSTVTISSEVLSCGTLSEDQQRVVSRIRRSCDRMQRMIADVLDFARSHLGGGIPAIPSLQDMGEICAHVVDEQSAANPDRTISLDRRGDLRGTFDRDRVAQAIGNLVGNAIEHGQGPIEVVGRESPDRQQVIVTVTSHGKAISPEDQRRIFDPFVAGEANIARNGLGLGLFIVQQIALAHGATIDLTSDEHATTFTSTWPRVPDEQRLKLANA